MNRKSPFRCFFYLSIFFILVSTLPSHGAKLEHPLDIVAEVSTGEHLKYSGPIPVSIDITNRGNHFRGRIALVGMNYAGEDGDTFYQDIEIPKFGKKRFFLYIPNQERRYSNKVILRISKDKHFRDIDISLRQIKDEDIIMMILNKQRGGLSNITNYRQIIPQNRTLFVTYPEPARLPLEWKGYGNIDVIVINDFPALKMSREQEKSILNYVKSGGMLLISTNFDPKEYNNSIFQDYLPLKPVSTIPIPEDSAVFQSNRPMLTNGKITGEVVIDYLDHPMLIKRKIGEGSIFYLTSNLSTKPFTEYYERDVIWKAIINNLSGTDKNQVYLDLNPALQKLPEMEPPNLGVIFWIMFLYIILVGPLNYFYLKKKDRLHILYYSVPAIALFFSIGIFSLGYITKGSSILQRNLSIVYIRNQQKSAFVDSAVSFFSPNNAGYNILVEGPAVTGWEMSDRRSEENMLMKQEQDSITFKDQRIQMWSLRLYRTQRVVDLDGSIELNLSASKKDIRGMIYNYSGYELKNCVIFNNGMVSNSFDLKKGENQIYLTLSGSSFSGAHALAAKIESEMNLKKLKEDPLQEVRIVALKTLCNQIFTTTDTPVLLGWSDEEIDKVRLENKKPVIHNVSLFYVR